MEKKYGIWAVRSSGSIFGAAEDWCKDYGIPIEFNTETEAKAYAKKLNSGLKTVNVRYYVKEKEPEPIVYIRSAAHSNYTGMVAMIGTDKKVYLGKKENYVFGSGKPAHYKNYDGSLVHITDRQDMYCFLYGEGWVLSQEEMLKNGLTIDQYIEFAKLRDGVLKQFEVRREIKFANQPFREPDNYLLNAEIYKEGQTGNYNMINGLIDDKISLEDERNEIEKQSVVERLKAEHTEHTERQTAPFSPHKELS